MVHVDIVEEVWVADDGAEDRLDVALLHVRYKFAEAIHNLRP